MLQFNPVARNMPDTAAGRRLQPSVTPEPAPRLPLASSLPPLARQRQATCDRARKLIDLWPYIIAARAVLSRARRAYPLVRLRLSFRPDLRESAAAARSGSQDRPRSGRPQGLVLTPASTVARSRQSGASERLCSLQSARPISFFGSITGLFYRYVGDCRRRRLGTFAVCARDRHPNGPRPACQAGLGSAGQATWTIATSVTAAD